jgi:hypothetical protein
VELLNAEQFIKIAQDASENGKAAVLYLARLVYENRSFRSEQERGNVGAELFAAERRIRLPIRIEALDILEACSEVIEDIQSAWLALSEGEEDIRSKVRPYAEERRAKIAADNAAADATKRKLESVEENLLIRGRA